MAGLGTMIAGGKGAGAKRGRSPADFYPTPPACTWAMLDVLGDALRAVPGPVWEPACGTGSMVAPLRVAGFDVIATDLHDRGCPGQVACRDFKAFDAPLARKVATNPPFSEAEAFTRHALGLGVDVLVLLLKATYWHTAERQALWAASPPTHELVVTWRVDFTGEGGSAMDTTWWAWVAEARGTFTKVLLPRPKALPAGMEEAWRPLVGEDAYQAPALPLFAGGAG